MKFAYTLSAIAGLTMVLAADSSSSLTDCQTTCSDSVLASNSTCGSSFSACACDNVYVQNVKICLYKGSCSTDVSTWFDTASAACEATGAEANYTSTHESNYTWSSDSASGSATSSPVSSASASASSSSSSSGALPAQRIGAAALAFVGAVVGSAMLF
ncbi:hypothetical protein I350_07546 [Cryptococcus amylolentus CBS 6273]|uniref:CFEM domain-containing protein n=1 Tax=Cryptococcus amylolentus CBS 6273 TaxID=1296118 RepID=A0A1E3JAL5_9TREE|nr:hypothetical protein I350_07546 [Cryptococcus amylolentus CBS 6273]